MAENDPKGTAPDPRRTQRKVWTPEQTEPAEVNPRATQRKVWAPEQSESAGPENPVQENTRSTQRINPVAPPTMPTEHMKPQVSSEPTAPAADATEPIAGGKKKSKVWLWILLVVLILGGGAAAWYFLNNDSKPRAIDDEEETAELDYPTLDEFDRPAEAVPDNYGDSIPAEVAREMHVTEVAIVPDDAHSDEIKSQEEQSRSNTDRAKVADQSVADEVRAPVPSDDKVYSMAMVEQRPSFPGGEAAMYRWLGENIHYPAQAQEEGVQGRVVVQFDVSKTGQLTNVKVVRSRHPALDKEALRVVKSMPVWSPGRNNGLPVIVTYTLPVTFRLNN